MATNVESRSTTTHLAAFDRGREHEKHNRIAEAILNFTKATSKGYAPAQACLLRLLTSRSFTPQMIPQASSLDNNEVAREFVASFTETPRKLRMRKLEALARDTEYPPALFYYGRYGGFAYGEVQCRMITRAVELGNAAAMNWLSHLHQTGGGGVEQDEALDQYYLERAAFLGDPEALCALGARLVPITKKLEQIQVSRARLLRAVAMYEEAASYGHERGIKLFVELARKFPDLVQPFGDFNPPYGGNLTWWKFRRFPKRVRDSVLTTSLVFQRPEAKLPRDIVHMIIGYVCTK